MNIRVAIAHVADHLARSFAKVRNEQGSGGGGGSNRNEAPRGSKERLKRGTKRAGLLLDILQTV
jgi:hypothetical protein